MKFVHYQEYHQPLSPGWVEVLRLKDVTDDDVIVLKIAGFAYVDDHDDEEWWHRLIADKTKDETAKLIWFKNGK